MLAFLIVVVPERALKPSSGMLVGLWVLALAVVPWASYPYLVSRFANQRARRRD
jgi:hypothetical protein